MKMLSKIYIDFSCIKKFIYIAKKVQCLSVWRDCNRSYYGSRDQNTDVQKNPDPDPRFKKKRIRSSDLELITGVMNWPRE